MTEHGLYEVVGRREYRGNGHGERFIARLDLNAAARAVRRGDIVLLRYVTPELPAEWGLPAGWSANKERSM